MPTPKFRLFAGPNASGKTTVFKKFKRAKIIHTEVYVNADQIENQIRKVKRFSFNSYRVKVDDSGFKNHIITSGLFLEKIKDPLFVNNFAIESGILKIARSVKINSYHASFIATYLAEKLFETRQSFAFETVMSHPSKVDLLTKAKSLGYKTYFYFIFLDNLDTNLSRVALRVLEGGHDVPAHLTTGRAPRVFKLLPKAFAAADSAYVIDNSFEATAILSKENDTLFKADDFPVIIKKPLERIIRDFSGKIENI